jgi:RimJ/RimL family protein N-acetyltransferase
MVLETDRLTLRPWDAAADLEEAFRMYNDPEVVRHIGGEARRVKNHEEMRSRLETFMKVREDGLGRWAIEAKQARRVVGTVILDHIQQAFGTPFDEIEIGWHLAREAWGQGYASEAAKALLRYGFETLGFSEIFAVLTKDNGASARVAKRIGMTRIGETDRYYGQVLELYRITPGEAKTL